MGNDTTKAKALLARVLNTFPFTEPGRVIETEDGRQIAEWQGADGKYFEIEANENHLEVMAELNGKYSHYEIYVRYRLCGKFCFCPGEHEGPILD